MDLQSFRAKRQHQHQARDLTRATQLGNGQYLTTIPREITRWKKISKGSVLKWSDAGSGRILLEIIADKALESKDKA